jgi:hypothetical protein
MTFNEELDSQTEIIAENALISDLGNSTQFVYRV